MPLRPALPRLRPLLLAAAALACTAASAQAPPPEATPDGSAADTAETVAARIEAALSAAEAEEDRRRALGLLADALAQAVAAPEPAPPPPPAPTFFDTRLASRPELRHRSGVRLDTRRTEIARLRKPEPEVLPADEPLVAEARVVGAGYLAVPTADLALVEREEALIARRFGAASRRARRFFPMIERTLARHRLPTALKYVAVIESGLDPTAQSHAGATGLWQFMPGTAVEYGLDSLTVLNPQRSTEAAARYLRRLARMFDGDWQLALASYNGGPGRVLRLTRAHKRRTGQRATFWDIRAQLPRETQTYVPRFIAAVRHFEKL